MAVIKLDGGYNALPISYKRGNPIPLDTTALWVDAYVDTSTTAWDVKTAADAQNNLNIKLKTGFERAQHYASNGVTAYVGQVLTVVASENAAHRRVIVELPVFDAKGVITAEKIKKTLYCDVNEAVSPTVFYDIYGNVVDSNSIGFTFQLSGPKDTITIKKNDTDKLVCNLATEGQADPATGRVVLKYTHNNAEDGQAYTFIWDPIPVAQISTAYVIENEDGVLKEVGSSPVGDDLSISVSDEGVISIYDFDDADTYAFAMKDADGKIAWKSLEDYLVGDEKTIECSTENGVVTAALHDYGKAFYKYIDEVVENGVVTVEAHYEKTEVNADNLWSVGLEPRVVSEKVDGVDTLVLGWFEPNPTTVEGLSKSITSLTERVATVEAANYAPDEKSIESYDIKEGSVTKQTVLAIKGAYDSNNANKVLTTDGAGNVTWVADKNDNTAHTHTAGQGLTITSTDKGGVDGDVVYAHNNAPTSGNKATATAGSGRTYITEVLVDNMGHVAGVKTATETVVNTDTDTQTAVTSGDSYIQVKPNTGLAGLNIGGENTFELSINETKLVELIGRSTTAAMEFKGATAELPTDANTKDGDMYKVVGEAELKVEADKDAQGVGFSAKAGDAIVAKVTGEGEAKVVTWYYIPSANEQDTWRTVQVNGVSIGDKTTLNLKPGHCISLSNTNGAVTIGLDRSSLVINESDLSSSLQASIEAANNAVEKDQLIKYITEDQAEEILVSENNLPFPSLYVEEGGYYECTELNSVTSSFSPVELEEGREYVIYITGGPASSARATALNNGDSIGLTFQLGDYPLTIYTYEEGDGLVTTTSFGPGPIMLPSEYNECHGTTMTLKVMSELHLGIEPGAQVNYINDVDNKQFAVSGKKLALNKDLADKIDSALQPVEGAGEGHYAVFDADGKIVDGGYIYGHAQAASDTEAGMTGVNWTLNEHSGANMPGASHDNPVLDVMMYTSADDGLEITDVRITHPENAGQNGGVEGDRTENVNFRIGLTDAVKASLAKADSAVQPVALTGYKTKQTAVTSPDASGNATAFIDSITQDANGVITATKKNVLIGDGKFEVKAGSDYLTASGSMTANQATDTSATIDLATNVKSAISNAVQTITTKCSDTAHSHDNTCGGLKAVKTGTTVNIEIDDSITFILNCGSAADL